MPPPRGDTGSLRNLDATPAIVAIRFTVNGGLEEQFMDAMLDVGYVVLIVAMFAASAWLIRFCADLLGDKGERS